MALSIKNREVEEKARKLARLTGKPITEALSDSLDLSLQRHRSVQRPTDNEAFMARIQEIQKQVAALPVLDNRSADEVLGYNEFGHFD